MRIDLFEFVESVFRGFVYFVYNALETLWDLTRSPRRGPVRRHRAHQRENERQIGGLTFLFLLFFAIFGLAALLSGDNGTAGALKSAPDLTSDAVWLPLLGAMIAAVIVDATLRLVLRWRLPGRRTKRRMLLSVVEYSLTWPVLIAFLLPLVLVLSPQPVADLLTPLVALTALWLVAALACAPATAFLYFCARDRDPRRGSGTRGWAVRGLMQAGVALLVIAAGVSGGVAAVFIAEAEDGGPEEPTWLVHADFVRCLLDDPEPHVVATFRNPTRIPLVIDIDRHVLLLVVRYKNGERGGSVPVELVAPEGPDALPVLIVPGATQLVRMDLDGPLPQPIGDYGICTLGSDNGGPSISHPREWDVEPSDGAKPRD